MRRSLPVVAAVLLLPALLVAAEKRLAVLELLDEGAELTPFELSALTDDVRAAALVLQPSGYIVMTRESMLAVLGPGGTDVLKRCTGASCEVEAGRTLGADLVVAGTVGRFSGKLEARVKLFDTLSASLVAQRKAQGTNLDMLREAMEAEASALFAAVTGGPAAVPKVSMAPRKAESFPAPRAAATGASGDMVTVPAGEFWMGCNGRVDDECKDDEKPGRSVYLPAFKIDTYEVTVAQYAECVAAGRCSTSGLEMPYWGEKAQPEWAWACNWNTAGRETHPVNCVDWNQAKESSAWAGQRLPTEAEWEKAARGGDGAKYAWGNDGYDEVRNVANIADATAGAKQTGWRLAEGYDDGFYGTAPVGRFPDGKSPTGVYDAIGNVWEWVADVYDAKAYTKLSTRSPVSDSGSGWRVIRGGAWSSSPDLARASFRGWPDPTFRSEGIGFRCAK